MFNILSLVLCSSTSFVLVILCHLTATISLMNFLEISLLCVMSYNYNGTMKALFCGSTFFVILLNAATVLVSLLLSLLWCLIFSYYSLCIYDLIILIFYVIVPHRSIGRFVCWSLDGASWRPYPFPCSFQKDGEIAKNQ